MNLGGIQIFVTLVVIIAAAGLALLVDYLKGKNEQLREAMAELQVRREEEHRRIAFDRLSVAAKMTQVPPGKERPEEARPVPPSPAPEAEAPMQAEEARELMRTPAAEANSEIETSAANEPDTRERNLMIRRAQERAAEVASTRGRRRRMTPAPENLVRLEDMNAKEALTDWLNKRAAAKSTKKPSAAVTGPVDAANNAESTMPGIDAVAEPAAAEAKQDRAEAPASAETVAPEQSNSTPKTASSSCQVVIDEALWESIVTQSIAKKHNRNATWAAAGANGSAVRLEVVGGVESSDGIPAGMHDESVFDRLLKKNRPFTGLVVSIAISANDARANTQDVMKAAAEMVSGLLHEKDFACRTSEDEFILLIPGERGAPTRHRMHQISERLWDFQIRGIASYPVLFSSGDVDVEEEPLTDAVASATERMNQTRRARKTVSMEVSSPRRKAV